MPVPELASSVEPIVVAPQREDITVKARQKSVSFKGLSPSSPTAARAKQSNGPSDTKHEIALRIELSRLGLRFRKNVPDLPGRPDIVFMTERLAVFCDGDFWHGRNWKHLSRKLRAGSNAPYWLAKIRSNRVRDRSQTMLLRRAGWTVLRFWETDVLASPTLYAQRVRKRLLDSARIQRAMLGPSSVSRRTLSPAERQDVQDKPAKVKA